MKVQLLGAAQTVTGSCYVISANNVRFAIDSGMHQGNSEIEKRNTQTEVYDAPNLDFILLTHAHIDHSGLLPRLVKDGFKGPVYCTEPTRDLLGIMLLDSAHIQEMEAEWANRKSARRGTAFVPPLYTQADAQEAIDMLKGVTYNIPFEPVPGVKVTYRDAGHILGSSFLELEVTEADGSTRIVFSGDLGRQESLFMENPAVPDQSPDYLFMESTYGDRNHKNEGGSRDELAEAIAYSYAHGEKTIIPAFAVERTQEIIYTLFLLHKEGRLPNDIPVYVDSPLAIKATEIFRKHPNYFDKDTIKLIEAGEDPLSLPNLKYTLSTKESQAINESRGPAIVISASGMCNAGRIKHHLRHNLWRPGASVVFVGYQGIGTPGRKIVDGAKSITMLGDEVTVAAKIFTIGGFSAHAGQSQLVSWAKTMARPDMTIFLVHGEEKAQNILAGILRDELKLKVQIPDRLEELVLAPGNEPLVEVDSRWEPQRVNWNILLEDTEVKINRLTQELAKAGERSWAEQVDLREQVMDLNNKVMRILSQL